MKCGPGAEMPTHTRPTSEETRRLSALSHHREEEHDSRKPLPSRMAAMVQQASSQCHCSHPQLPPKHGLHIRCRLHSPTSSLVWIVLSFWPRPSDEKLSRPRLVHGREDSYQMRDARRLTMAPPPRACGTPSGRPRKSVTLTPFLTSNWAANEPAGPAPTIKTSKSFICVNTNHRCRKLQRRRSFLGASSAFSASLR